MSRILLSAISVLALCGAPLAQAPVAPKCKALLVGISDYPTPTSDSETRDLPTDLAGPGNDVSRIRKALMRKYGFADADIVVLQDDQATHENVLKALHALGEQVGPDTCALFWYSGHGSLIPDRTKRESYKTLEDGTAGFFDGSLVCYDSRNDDKHNRDLSDDELYSLIRVIAKKAMHTVVVTDSCFSGGATRGGAEKGVRFHPAGKLPWDAAWVKSVFPKGVQYLDDDSKQREIDRQEGLRFVHIAACSDVEVARECEPETGRHFGALSWSIYTALNASKAPGSWREIANAARAGVSARHSQTVWFEGDLDKPVFGGTYRQTPPGYTAYVRNKGMLFVEAGRLHGIGVGAEFEVLDLAGKSVAKAKAERVLTGTCECSFVGEAPEHKDAAAFLCRPSGSSGSRAPLRIQLGKDVPADLLASSSYAVASTDGADGKIESRNGDLVLLDPDGFPARKLAAEREQREIELFREHAYVSLRELAAAQGRRKVTMAVKAMSKKEADSYSTTPASITTGRDGRVVATAPVIQDGQGGGGGLTLVVANKGSEPAHVAVLSICEDRSVNVLYPENGERSNVLAPGQQVTIPVLVGANADWTQSRPMVDRYLAVSTPAYADFSACESKATLSAVSATRGDGDTGLPPGLAFSMFGSATRGDSLAKRARDAAAASDFGVATIDILLPKPQ